jgi:hypothetical protein
MIFLGRLQAFLYNIFAFRNVAAIKINTINTINTENVITTTLLATVHTQDYRKVYQLFVQFTMFQRHRSFILSVVGFYCGKF